MPTSVLDMDTVPALPTPTSETQVAESPNDTTSDDHNAPGELVATTSGSSKSPTTAAMTVPPNQSSPVPDTTAIHGETSAETGGDSTSVGVKKLPKAKGKRFRPSTAKTIQYASQCYLFPATVFTTLRGVSEREWSRANPNGTRNEFREYFKGLEPEKLEVHRTTAGDNLTNTVF